MIVDFVHGIADGLALVFIYHVFKLADAFWERWDGGSGGMMAVSVGVYYRLELRRDALRLRSREAMLKGATVRQPTY